MRKDSLDHLVGTAEQGDSPIHLEQDCAAAIEGNFAERFSIKQVLDQANTGR